MCVLFFEIISGNALGMGVYISTACPTFSISHRRRHPTFSRRKVRHLSPRRLVKASFRCLIAHMCTVALKRCAPTPHICMMSCVEQSFLCTLEVQPISTFVNRSSPHKAGFIWQEPAKLPKRSDEMPASITLTTAI